RAPPGAPPSRRRPLGFVNCESSPPPRAGQGERSRRADLDPQALVLRDALAAAIGRSRLQSELALGIEEPLVTSENRGDELKGTSLIRVAAARESRRDPA